MSPLTRGQAANRIHSPIDAEKVIKFEAELQSITRTGKENLNQAPHHLKIQELAKRIFFPDHSRVQVIVTDYDIIVIPNNESPIRIAIGSSADGKTRFVEKFYEMTEDSPSKKPGVLESYQLIYLQRNQATDPIQISQDRIEEAFATCAVLESIRSPSVHQKLETILKSNEEAFLSNAVDRNGKRYVNPDNRTSMLAPFYEVIKNFQTQTREKLGDLGSRKIFSDGISFRVLISKPGPPVQFTVTPILRTEDHRSNELGDLHYSIDPKTRKLRSPAGITAKCNKDQFDRIQKTLVERASTTLAPSNTSNTSETIKPAN